MATMKATILGGWVALAAATRAAAEPALLPDVGGPTSIRPVAGPAGPGVRLVAAGGSLEADRLTLWDAAGGRRWVLAADGPDVILTSSDGTAIRARSIFFAPGKARR